MPYGFMYAASEWQREHVVAMLTGLTVEHCMFMMWGTGRNGKTTFLEVIQYLMGEYAKAALLVAREAMSIREVIRDYPEMPQLEAGED